MTMFTQHGLCWTCALLSGGLKCWCTWDRRHPHDQAQQTLARWVSNGRPWHMTVQAQISTCFWGISDSWKPACGFLYTLSVCLFFFFFFFSLFFNPFTVMNSVLVSRCWGLMSTRVIKPGVAVRMHSESNSVFSSLCPRAFNSSLLELRQSVVNYKIRVRELYHNFLIIHAHSSLCSK